jgi:hypothetical protein
MKAKFMVREQEDRFLFRTTLSSCFRTYENHGRTDNQPNLAYYDVTALLTIAAVFLILAVLRY